MPAPRSLRRLPLIGESIGRIGQVYDIFQTPCSPNPEVWFLAFFNGLPQLAWSFIKPEPLDWAGERFGRGHGRKRKRRFRAEGVISPKVPVGRGLGWATFSMYQLQQRVGFYLLLIDAGSEFVLNWTSTAYTWAGCRVTGLPYQERTRREVQQWVTGQDWQVAHTYEIAGAGLINGGNTIGVPKHIDVTLSATMTVDPIDGWPGTIAATRIRDVISGKVISQSEPTDSGNGHQVSTQVHRDYVGSLGYREFVFEFLPGPGGFGRSMFAQFSAHGKETTPQGLMPDP